MRIELLRARTIEELCSYAFKYGYDRFWIARRYSYLNRFLDHKQINSMVSKILNQGGHLKNNAPHKQLVNEIRIACSDEETRIFLNSTGTGYPIETIKALQSHIRENFPQLDKVVSDFIKRSPVSLTVLQSVQMTSLQSNV